MLAILLEQATNKIKSATNLANLEQARVEILGKNGTLSLEMRKLGSLPPEEKKNYGQELNQVKTQLESLLEERKILLLESELEAKLASEKLDVTLPGRVKKLGSIHPISQAQIELTEIFARLGFRVEEGPNIETDWHNFTALNIAENHPARQMHDTFYLPELEGQKLVLRTHTSPVQIRTMLANKPPLRFITPGRTYRSDYDQTHTPMFHQIEGLALDKNINMSHMKFVIIEFIKAFFEGQKVEVRFRPSFFPFTEPSAEVDIKFSDKADAKWLEVLGCGMIHPNVLRNCNIDPDEYQGFAFGLGLERMAMLKYGINDLRQFFESDIRWLKHYSFSSFDIPSLVGGLTR